MTWVTYSGQRAEARLGRFTLKRTRPPPASARDSSVLAASSVTLSMSMSTGVRGPDGRESVTAHKEASETASSANVVPS